MQYAEDGEILLRRKPPQQAHDLLGGLGIEARDGLVGEQHARLLRQRASDGDALRLPPDKRAGALVRKVGRAPLPRDSPEPPQAPLAGSPPSAVQRSWQRPSAPVATLAKTLRRRTSAACWEITASWSRARRSCLPARRLRSCR